MAEDNSLNLNLDDVLAEGRNALHAQGKYLPSEIAEAKRIFSVPLSDKERRGLLDSLVFQEGVFLHKKEIPLSGVKRNPSKYVSVDPRIRFDPDYLRKAVDTRFADTAIRERHYNRFLHNASFSRTEISNLLGEHTAPSVSVARDIADNLVSKSVSSEKWSTRIAGFAGRATTFPQKTLEKYPKLFPITLGSLVAASALQMAAQVMSGQTIHESRHTNLETHAGRKHKKAWGLPYEEHSKVDSSAAVYFAQDNIDKLGDPFGAKKEAKRGLNHNVATFSEYTGRAVSLSIDASVFLHGFLKNETLFDHSLPFKERMVDAFKNRRTLSNLKAAAHEGLESANKYAVAAGITGAAVSAGLAIKYGKNYEEKFQGGALFLSTGFSEVTSWVAAKVIADKLLGKAHPLYGVADWVLREGLGNVLSLVTAPTFARGLAKVGRIIDERKRKQQEESAEEQSTESPRGTIAPVLQPERTYEHVRQTSPVVGNHHKATVKLHLKDKRLDKEDVDEAYARRIRWGHAF